MHHDRTENQHVSDSKAFRRQTNVGSQSLKGIVRFIKSKITTEACIIFSCLIASYFLALASYQLAVAPYLDLWPTDYKLVALLLTMSPVILLIVRGIFSVNPNQTPRTTAILTLVLGNLVFISFISLGYYRTVHSFSEYDLRPVLWAVFWLVLPPLMVEIPRYYTRYLTNPRFLDPKVAVLATAGSIERLAESFKAERNLKHIYGLDTAGPCADLALKGKLDDLIEHGKKRGIKKIVLTSLETEAWQVESVVETLVPLAADIYLHTIAETEADAVEEQPLSSWPFKLVSRRPLSGTSLFLKGVEDFCLGAALTFMFAPLMAFIALAILIDSPGPVFFKQKRHGYRHQEIEVFKFRTMRTDNLDYGCAQQTRRGDPRITRVGSFLRKSSLDELPQLLNVMRGEMSLVGPRPHAVNMRTEQKLSHEIVPTYANRHQVKPGITGWAQVNGHRGAMDVETQLVNRVRFDMEYIKRCSVVFDFYILVRTIFHLAGTKNAY